MALWPSDVPIDDANFIYNENKSSTQSLFTRTRQVVTLDGGTSSRYEVTIRTAPLTNAQMQTLFDFLISTGLYGTFTWEPQGWTTALSPSVMTWVLTSIPNGHWNAKQVTNPPVTVTAEQSI